MAEFTQRPLDPVGAPSDLLLGRGDLLRRRVRGEHALGNLALAQPFGRQRGGGRGLLGLLDPLDVEGKTAEADRAGDGDGSRGRHQQSDEHEDLVHDTDVLERQRRFPLDAWRAEGPVGGSTPGWCEPGPAYLTASSLDDKIMNPRNGRQRGRPRSG
ncbi:hypothetical protein [Elioraea sp.]|uniref:hypothetical protein n=1 Tax=Elioraea sp. TaxID=2185103 RepID=UPI003F7023DA